MSKTSGYPSDYPLFTFSIFPACRFCSRLLSTIFFAGWLLLIRLAQPAGAQIEDDARIPAEYRAIRYAMGERNYDKAWELIDRSLQREPVYTRILGTAADLFVYEERYEEGIAFFKARLKSGKNQGENTGALAILFHYLGSSSESFQYARTALEQNCQLTWPYELYVNKGNELQNNELVLDFLTEQSQRYRKNWQYRYAIALWYVTKNDPESTCNLLQSLLEEGIRHWRIYYVLGENLKYSGDLSTALRIFNEGIDYCRRIQDEKGLAKLFKLRSGVELDLGQPREAQYSIQQSLELARRIGHRELEYSLLINIVQGLINRQQWSTARENLHIVVKEAQKFSDGYHLFLAYYYLAILEREVGRWKDALENALNTYTVADSLGWHSYLPQIIYTFSRLDSYSSRKAQALESYRKIREWIDKDGLTLHRSLYLYNEAYVLFDLGRYRQALKTVDEALLNSHQGEDKRLLLQLKLLKSIILIRLERIAEARSLLKGLAEEAFGSKYMKEWISAKIYWAELFLKENKIRSAKATLKEALASMQDDPQYLLYLEATKLLAEATLRDGDPQSTLPLYKSAMEVIELHTQTLSPGSLSSFTSEERAIFFGLSRVLLLSGEIEEALEVTERARDIIVQRKRWQALLLSEAGIDSVTQAQLAEVDTLLLNSQLRQATAKEPKETESLMANIKKLEHRREALLDMIYNDDERPRLTQDSIDIAKIQRHLADRDEMAISYFVGDSVSLIFLVTGDTIKWREISAGQQKIRELLAQIHPLLQSKSDEELAEAYTQLNTEAANQAYRLLFSDLLEGRDESALAVVPDDALHAFPFDISLSQEHGKDRYLIERYPIRYGLSLRSLLPKSTDILQVKSILMLANPELPTLSVDQANTNGVAQFPLEYTAFEAKKIEAIVEIETLLTGPNASRANLLGPLLECDWIHIASHSSSRAGEPLFSEITLSTQDGHSTPEKLYAFEIFQMRLKAKLAILSGCETGRGAFLNGEGFEGFVQAFRAAGAPSVLASLWRVDDRATAYFFESYYEALMRQGSSARALQTAKLKMINNPDFSLLDWAAFSYYGPDWQVRLDPAKEESYVFWVLMAGLALGIGLLYSLRHFRSKSGSHSILK